MNQALFSFQAELNDFLPNKLRGVIFSYPFEDHQTIKHVIESMGIPHCEVNHLRINECAVNFSARIGNGDMVSIYPVSQPAGSQDIVLQPKPDTVDSFLLDNHLGRLASYLRMLGFDTLYQNDYQDDELAEIASHENRTLLTRDRRLLMRNSILSGYCIRHLDPRGQLMEVNQRFSLASRAQPFLRCLRCNHLLDPISKDAVLSRLEPLTRQYFDDFHICPACNQIYWKGSHYDRMVKLVSELIKPGF